MTETSTPPPSSPRPDGRRLRTEDSRRRVVAALLKCVRDGDFDPSAEAVAHEAGVGLRTVFRLFKDKEGLIRQMSGLVRDQFADLAATPVQGDTWRERLDDIMNRRFVVFEHVMPYRRAGYAHAHHSAFVRGNNESIQQTLRSGLRGVVPEALRADPATFDALEMSLSIDTWIRLRIDQTLEPERAAAAVRRIVGALTAGFA
jgi:AcrR family transcriptional regulator